MNLYTTVSARRLIVAAVLLFSISFGSLLRAQTFHGAAILKNPVGPDGTPRAHVGDTITATITVMNLDDFLDTVTISNIFDIVHHSSLTVTSANLLPGPIILDSFLTPFGTNSIDVTHSYTVLAGDQNLPSGLLLDDAQTKGTDNHDGLNATHIRQDFVLTFPGQVYVVNPCMRVTKTCLNGVGAAGTVSYSGSVSNCGNTVLTNVIVSNFVNGAWVYVTGPTTLGTNGPERFITFNGSYTPNDPCHPATDTLMAWGTDELGLIITNSASATCPIRQTLTITCPPDVTVQCFGNVPPPNPRSVIVISSAGSNNVMVTHGGDVITTNGCVLTIRRTYDAVDCWTNLASCTQTITVRDTIPPTLVGVPTNQTYSCLAQVPPPPVVTAIDNCVTNPQITRVSTTNGSRPTLIVHCWTAMDACSNATTQCQTNTVLDLGAAVGDFVWEDRNHNGLQDVGEPGIANVGVQLTDCSGNVLASTLTDGNGLYLFSGLAPGSYRVRFPLPGGFQFTLPNIGTNDAIDSDADLATGLSPCITLACGETNRTVDAGVFRPGTIGDFVWEDRNHNGLQEAGEPGISNALVRLLDCLGIEIARTNTDVNGLYLFSGLMPGSYIVEFLAPSGFAFTLPNMGADDTIDSDANPVTGRSPCTTLASGEVNRTIDAGLFRTTAIGDFVWEDRNRNGLQDTGEPGIPNVSVRLLDCTGVEITRTNTDANGLYLFSGLAPGGYIVQFVAPGGYTFTVPNVGANDTIDSDANPSDGRSPCTTLMSGEVNRTVDAGLFRGATIGDFVWEDRNHNGLQDAGEPGIPNVRVRLLDCAGVEIARTNTDANGIYLFTGLPPGSYMVEFTAPSTYTFTLANVGGNDAIDSDANPADGRSPCTTLTSGEVNRTIDAGLFRPATIGDFVWEDTNRNGIQEIGELGVPNVEVRLLDCSGSFISSIQTDIDGVYHFSNLLPGNYMVQFVLPAGRTFTLQHQGGDPGRDSDADPNTGRSQCVTLASGDVNLTIDAGLVTPPSNCVPTCVIGAWSDPALRSPDKPPGRNQAVWMKGISTNLVFYPEPGQWTENPDGSVTVTGTARSLTNLSSGFYVTVTFSGRQNAPPVDSPLLELAPGAYIQNGGPIDPSTWYYYSAFSGTLTGFGFWQGAQISVTRSGPAFQVGEGANGKNAHFGASAWFDWRVLAQPASGQLPSAGMGDFNWDIYCCTPATLGDFVWVDLNQNGIQDAGEPGIPNAAVRLLDCTNKVVLTNTTTDANGAYAFTNLLPGSYIVQFVAPNGFQFTQPFQGFDPALDSNAGANGNSQCVTLTSNEVNRTIDAGLISNCPPTCVIGAWSDPTYRPADKPPGRNQAIWMRDISTNLVFSPDPGSWVENSDGTALLTGTVYSLTNTSSGFQVTLNLSGRTSSPPSGSPKLELDPRAYVQNGGPLNPANWYYYPNFTGLLTGFGFWENAQVTISRYGPAFQVGVGANGKNQDFGASAWFNWRVVRQPFSGNLISTGTGDFNFDLFCCAMPRVIALQNISPTLKRMKIQAIVGPNYLIEGSTDLITWKSVATVPNLNGTLQFTDPAGNSRCFYRIKMQP